LQSENRQGSAIVNAVSVRTGCNRAIAIPTIEVGNKESVNYCVAESVIPNKYRQHGTIYSQVPKDSDPIKTALARANSIYVIQTGPLMREGIPQNQD
jgi:hypothetical protein